MKGRDECTEGILNVCVFFCCESCKVLIYSNIQYDDGACSVARSITLNE